MHILILTHHHFPQSLSIFQSQSLLVFHVGSTLHYTDGSLIPLEQLGQAQLAPGQRCVLCGVREDHPRLVHPFTWDNQDITYD